MAYRDNPWLEMNIHNPKGRPGWLRHASHPLAPVVVNVLGALLMLGAALRPPFPLSYLYPTTLAWIPVAAFGLAAIAPCQRIGSWLPLVALGGNVAGLVLCFLAGVAAATEVRIGSSGLAIALPGAAIAAWNVLRLSRSLELD